MSVDDAPGAPSTNFTLADIRVVPATFAFPVDQDADDAQEVITSIVGAFEGLAAVDGEWVTVAAAAPTGFVTPLYYDSTAISGGLYAWDGGSYVQIGGLIA